MVNVKEKDFDIKENTKHSHGKTGNLATFHSTSTKAIHITPPATNIPITNGEFHAYVDPPAEIGTSTRMFAPSESKEPRKSIFASLERMLPRTLTRGMKKWMRVMQRSVKGGVHLICNGGARVSSG